MYSNAAEIVTAVKRSLRETVQSDELVKWLDDVQEDVSNEDIPANEKVATFSSTDGTLVYTASSIASDIRAIREVYIDLTSITQPSYDYQMSDAYQKRYLGFKYRETEDKVYLKDDPGGETVTIVYYFTPTPVTTTSSALSVPLRWRRVYYLGMMAMAEELQMKMVGSNWIQAYERYKEKRMGRTRTQNKGARRVQPYTMDLNDR